MRRKFARRANRFPAMVATYCLGVMNDNFFKQAACLIAISAGLAQLQGIGGIIFTIPWLIFAAPGGLVRRPILKA